MILESKPSVGLTQSINDRGTWYVEALVTVDVEHHAERVKALMEQHEWAGMTSTQRRWYWHEQTATYGWESNALAFQNNALFVEIKQLAQAADALASEVRAWAAVVEEVL